MSRDRENYERAWRDKRATETPMGIPGRPDLPDSIRAIWWPTRGNGNPWVAEFRKGHGYSPLRKCSTTAEAVRVATAEAKRQGVDFVSEVGANDQDP